MSGALHPSRRIALLAATLAAAFALAYGAFFVFGPTGTMCSITARPGEPPSPQVCRSTTFLEIQRDSLFPALLFIGAWTLAPLVGWLGVRLALGGRPAALALTALALLVDCSGLPSLGGGFVYALVPAPLLLLALVAAARSRPRAMG